MQIYALRAEKPTPSFRTTFLLVDSRCCKTSYAERRVGNSFSRAQAVRRPWPYRVSSVRTEAAAREREERLAAMEVEQQKSRPFWKRWF